ncbi:helix-turn-helix transcriptional regulator [Streptomyces sp. NBC_00338]|uniref:ArsR/SmtB family transcription factor n=1 Tax=Streptomyces sp. NBC_00338 TaxID=2975715 RepID=UPI0022578F2B|nr:helix-turn-helix domain-containing protein [Streptomyces sp. NBC_00338]MCX5143356.1 helix-turn-helix domain-containing protein [Streptomyces sp. NBC_00338]
MPEQPGGTEITELAALKALAQPRRQQILQHLTLHGPATSAILARALGLNTGATSYHLRELARYGFVADTAPPPAPGARRARWWRAVPGDRRFPPPSRRTPGMRLVMDELNRHAYAADLALFERLQRESGAAAEARGTDGRTATGRTATGRASDGHTADGRADEWADAHAYSRGSLRLTLAELQEFFEEYIALMNRYKRPDAETPAGARTVHTRLLAFPDAPGPDAPGPDAPGPDAPDPDGSAPDDASQADNRRETDAS